MNIALENLFIRLENLYHRDPLFGANQLKELVAETVELVELHMPEIDISKGKRSLNRQRRTWEAKLEIEGE